MGDEGCWRLVHAGAVLLGVRAVLIRGASGAGKSRLAYDLLDAAAASGRFARLVADDRVEMAAVSGRLLARAPAALAGLLEIRGVGIVEMRPEPLAVVGLIVDLERALPPRMPEEDETAVAGVVLPRLAFAAGDARAAAIVLGHTSRFFAPPGPAGIAGGRSPLPSCHPFGRQVSALRP